MVVARRLGGHAAVLEGHLHDPAAVEPVHGGAVDLLPGRLRARYTVTPSAKLLILTRRLLPDRAWDGLLRGWYPQPGG